MKLQFQPDKLTEDIVISPVPRHLKHYLFPWQSTIYRPHRNGGSIIQLLQHRDFTMHHYVLEAKSSWPILLEVAAPTISFQFTLEGSAVATMANGPRHELRSNYAGLFFLPIGVNKAWISPGLFRSVHVELSRPLVEELAKDLPEFQELHDKLVSCNEYGLPLRTVPIHFVMQEVIRKISNLDNFPTQNLLMKTGVIELVSLYNQSLSVEQELEALPPMLHKDVLVKIKNEIDADPNIEQYKLSRLAKKYYLNKLTISQSFMHMFGMQISEYIRLKVMEKALYLLVHTNQSISDIADQLGYSTNSNFTRSFSDVYGETPIEVRKNRGLIVPTCRQKCGN